MAFIRQYMEAGDPFRFRLPRIIRPPKKLRGALGKIGHFVGKVAPIASLVPGLQPLALARLGGLAGKAGKIGKLARLGVRVGRGVSRAKAFRQKAMMLQALAAAHAAAADETENTDTQEMTGGADLTNEQVNFARAYGFDQGDPVKMTRRKGAASGPAAKASAKRSPTGHVGGPAARRGVGSAHTGLATGANPRINLHALLQGGASLLGQSGIASALGKAHAKDFGLGGSGGHRRQNVTNVKALRRSLRRVEGFAKLATKVQKDAGKILRHVARPNIGVGHGQVIRMASGRGRGHKAGCGCVVCSRG